MTSALRSACVRSLYARLLPPVVVAFIAVIAASVLAPPAKSGAASTIRYHLVDLGTLGGSSSGGGGLTEAGDATGWSDASGQQSAFLWQESTGMRPACALSGGNAINSSLRVVGYTRDNKGAYAAAICDGTTKTMLPNLGSNKYGQAYDVNEDGAVVGVSGSHAFRYAGGQMLDLTATLGNPTFSSEARAINDAGHIVGHRDFSDIDSRAFLLNGSALTNINAPPGGPVNGWDYVLPQDVNNNDEVVGYMGDCQAHCFAIEHAFYYASGVTIDIGTLPDHEDAYAEAINDDGVIVGWGHDTYLGNHAFVYRDGQMLALTGLVDNAPGWVINTASDINNAGVILANAYRSGTGNRAVLLVPTDQPSPPPSSAPSPELLDDFNRADENPVSQGGNWAFVGVNGGAPAPLVQNQLKNFPTPGYSYRVTPYLGGEMEAGATVTTRPANGEWLSVFVALQDAGTPTYDGYELRATMLNGSPDRWEVIRITDGQQTPLATDFFEIERGGTMLLRRGAYRLEFWWKPPGGAWQRRLADETALADITYRWGKIGAGGVRSGALDDFVGGSQVSLLDQYAPQLRFTNEETYRSSDAALATDLYFEGADHSNLLKRNEADQTVTIAAADPAYPEDTLSLDYLNSQAQPGDFLDQPSSRPELHPVVDAAIDYTNWVTNPDHQDYNRVIYGRTIGPNALGETLLQYWIYYYYNPKNFLGTTGWHEGDWESVQVRLNSNDVPVSSAFSQHGGGERCTWSTTTPMPISDAGNPVVYVAQDSHANYFGPGEFSTPAPLNPDETRDDGPSYREVPRVEPVTANSPAWIATWDGRWGASLDGNFQSPRTPGMQNAWQDPWAWHDRASECRSLPPSSPAQMSHASSPQRTTLTTLSTVPALPRIVSARIVRDTKYGRALRLAYCFRSLGKSAGSPTSLRVTLDNVRDHFAPLSLPWRVRTRCATITQPVGGIKAPYVVRFRAVNTKGEQSRVGVVKPRS